MDKLWLAMGLQCPYYEDDSGSESEGGESNDNSDGKKTFTQEEVNNIIAREKRTFANNAQKTVAQLKALQETAQLTQQERDELQKQIADLEQQHLSKVELAEREKKKVEKTLTSERDKAIAERNEWANRYTQSRIQTELMQAAVTNDAYNPEQIIAITAPQSKLIPVTDDDGKATGDYKVLTTVKVKDDKGEEKTLSVSPAEAVKLLSENEAHFNMFKGKGAGGTGGSNRSGSKATLRDVARDPKLYRELKAKGQLPKQ